MLKKIISFLVVAVFLKGCIPPPSSNTLGGADLSVDSQSTQTKTVPQKIKTSQQEWIPNKRYIVTKGVMFSETALGKQKIHHSGPYIVYKSNTGYVVLLDQGQNSRRIATVSRIGRSVIIKHYEEL